MNKLCLVDKADYEISSRISRLMQTLLYTMAAGVYGLIQRSRY